MIIYVEEYGQLWKMLENNCQIRRVLGWNVMRKIVIDDVKVIGFLDYDFVYS